MRKLMPIILMLIMASGCATTKRIFHPINLQEGMTKSEVANEFAFDPERIKFGDDVDDRELWIYRMGQGLSVANDRVPKEVAGYEWYIYFYGDWMVDQKCWQYGY